MQSIGLSAHPEINLSAETGCVTYGNRLWITECLKVTIGSLRDGFGQDQRRVSGTTGADVISSI